MEGRENFWCRLNPKSAIQRIFDFLREASGSRTLRRAWKQTKRFRSRKSFVMRWHIRLDIQHTSEQRSRAGSEDSPSSPSWRCRGQCCTRPRSRGLRTHCDCVIVVFLFDLLVPVFFYFNQSYNSVLTLSTKGVKVHKTEQIYISTFSHVIWRTVALYKHKAYHRNYLFSLLSKQQQFRQI